jgi:hypothetical protein
MGRGKIAIILLAATLLTIPALPTEIPTTEGLPNQILTIKSQAEVKQTSNTGVIIEAIPSPLTNASSESNGTLFRVTISETIPLSDGLVVTAAAAVAGGFAFIYKASPSHIEDVERRNKREWELRLLRSGLLKAIHNTNRIFRKPGRALETQSGKSEFLCAIFASLSILPNLVEPFFLLTGLQRL